MSDPSRYNFTMYRKATFVRTFFWKNPDGTPIDMTGMTVEMPIKASLSANTNLIEPTTENGGIVLDEVNGSITVTIDDAVIDALVADNLYYTLKAIVGGEPLPILFGKIILSNEVF